MIYRLAFIWFFIFAGVCLRVRGKDIEIGLFTRYSLEALVISCVEGEFNVFAGDSLRWRLGSNDAIYITSREGSLMVWEAGSLRGVFRQMSLTPAGRKPHSFSLKPVSPALKPREYNGSIKVYVSGKYLALVNRLDLEDYLCGVVATEAGPGAPEEYYKAQAVICRTFALKNREKHLPEGFNLCDNVHCQAYKGINHHDKRIDSLTAITEGSVLVDRHSDLITAAYHSNSGGETASSEMAWLKSLDYLIAVWDPFSEAGQRAEWERKIWPELWKQYLQDNGFRVPPDAGPGYFCREAANRKKYYVLGDDSIAYSTLRTDWDLRSAFFSICNNDSLLLFKGKGYGHGVGLSQEGAMQMAREGYSFREILGFYYRGAVIVDVQPE